MQATPLMETPGSGPVAGGFMHGAHCRPRRSAPSSAQTSVYMRVWLAPIQPSGCSRHLRGGQRLPLRRRLHGAQVCPCASPSHRIMAVAGQQRLFCKAASCATKSTQRQPTMFCRAERRKRSLWKVEAQLGLEDRKKMQSLKREDAAVAAAERKRLRIHLEERGAANRG